MNYAPIKFLLSKVRTQAEALEVWEAHWDLLDGHTFVLSHPHDGNALRLPARIDFPDGGHLRSAFAHDRLWFLSHDLLARGVKHGRVVFPVDYGVGFDANVASYLRAWMRGQNSSVVPMVQKVLRGLNGGRFNWDMVPYLMEVHEPMLAGRGWNEIYDTILASEWFAAADPDEFLRTGKVKPRASEGELAARAQKAAADWDRIVRNGLAETFEFRHQLLRACIAKMALIQLESPSPRAAGRKMERFLAFMDDELRCLSLYCARAALEFFARGGGVSFFRKVSNRGPNLRKNVRNVAWDFLQLQGRHEVAQYPGRLNAMTVPYFLTFDRGLADLMDLCPQRSCLIEPGHGFPVFFQDYDFEELVLSRYPELKRTLAERFSFAAHARRALCIPNFGALANRLEEELVEFETGGPASRSPASASQPEGTA